MAERRRRGLGRGLGALINSDIADEQSDGATQAAKSSNETAADDTTKDAPPADTSGTSAADRKNEEANTPLASQYADRPARPVDVFFAAKSHVATERVSRETSSSQPSTPRRSSINGKRREMPEVMTPRSRQTQNPDGSRSNNQIRSRSAPSGETSPARSVSRDSEPANSWISSVSRETGSDIDGAVFRAVPVDAISPNPRQPRQEFEEEAMAELVHSVREIGVLQPIVVRETAPGAYELVMGERRWRASQLAEKTTVPAIVRQTSDDDLLRDALLENIHRAQLNPLEEAAAYRQLLDDFQCTQDQLSERIGRSRPQISNTLRLMKLPPGVQSKVAAGVLSSGHARALLGLNAQDDMEALAQRIIAEGLSVRATEEAVTIAMRDSKSGVSRETPRRTSARYQQLNDYADALTDRLDTQVKITLGAKKGRIAIDFASVDDLQRLMAMIGSDQS